eukprot:1714466-Prymnesium_polylepis.1
MVLAIGEEESVNKGKVLWEFMPCGSGHGRGRGRGHGRGRGRGHGRGGRGGATQRWVQADNLTP